MKYYLVTNPDLYEAIKDSIDLQRVLKYETKKLLSELGAIDLKYYTRSRDIFGFRFVTEPNPLEWTAKKDVSGRLWYTPGEVLLELPSLHRKIRDLVNLRTRSTNRTLLVNHLCGFIGLIYIEGEIYTHPGIDYIDELKKIIIGIPIKVIDHPGFKMPQGLKEISWEVAKKMRGGTTQNE